MTTAEPASHLPASYLFVVADHEAGRRLDQVLAVRTLLQELSRSRLQGLIRQGQVTLRSGAGEMMPVKPGTLLKAGDRVTLCLPPPVAVDLVAEEIDFPILYEDADILVLIKPPGLVVHPADGHRQGTLVHGLLHHCRNLSGISGELRPGIVHRLDKDTSGCLVVAKHDRAHRNLVAQFKTRAVEKKYLALLRGTPAQDHGLVELPIGRHPVHRKKMAVRREGGRDALTRWRVKKRFAAGYTLVELAPATGRTHQLRVHMAALGHSLAGDRLYGRQADRDRLYGIERQWLHAAALSFQHPADGRRLSFTAPLWPDLQASLERLKEVAGEVKGEMTEGDVPTEPASTAVAKSRPQASPCLFAVTGGIASGKSRVAEYLARRGGFPQLDVDELARQLLAPGQPGWRALEHCFGHRFFLPDGLLDRAALRRAIFADQDLRQNVDTLLHPLIRREMRHRATEMVVGGRGDEPSESPVLPVLPILVEVPLLYEAGWEDDFALVIAVQADYELCRRRLQNRDGVDRRQAEAAIAAQLAPAEKARRADLLVDNSGTWEETRQRLDELLPLLQALPQDRG